MRWWCIVLACACGRVRFDDVSAARGDGGAVDDAIAGGGDAPMPDALMAITIGDTTIEPGDDAHPTGVAEASSFYATQNGVVDELVVYYPFDPMNDVISLIVGLYSDDGTGNPGTSLASATIQPGGTLATAAWYTVAIPQTTITSGQYYWIAAACPVGSGVQCSFAYKYYGATGGGACTPTPAEQCTQHSAQANLTTMPATWSPGTVFKPSINSYYATHD